MLIGYAKVSTGLQNYVLQLDALLAADCERVFTEMASGSSADRAKFAKALDMARQGDVPVVWCADVLALSLGCAPSTLYRHLPGRLPATVQAGC